MRKSIITVIICLILLVLPGPAEAAPVSTEEAIRDSMQDMVSEQLDNLDINDWQPFLKYLEQQGSNLLGRNSAKEIVADMIAGKFSFNWKDIFDGILDAFFRELKPNLLLMGKIIVIAVICSIFRNMNDSFNNPSVGEIGYFVCYSIVIIMIIQSLISILTVGREGIERMTSFMQTLFPLMTTLMAAMGNFASTSILKPAVGVLVGTVGTILKNIMIPLITLSAVITLINNIGEKVHLQRMGKLLNNLCVWTLTFVFTIFIGVLSIQGAVAASFDGISVRTAKFAMDTFVPIIGKMFSQSIDMVIGCSLLIKNAVGAAGLLIICLLCIAPGMKILSLVWVYKLSSALLEPIADKRIVECLSGIGSILMVFFVTVMGIALMFFLTIALVIGTGNASVMLR